MSRKTIGLYMPSINNRGGGEKTLLALAEHLSEAHDVQLIVKEEIDLAGIGRYLNVDTGRVNVLIQKDRPSLTAAAADRPGAFLRRGLQRYREYRWIKGLGLDIFINGEYHSNLRCPAPFGIYLCMFPQRLSGGSGNQLLRSISQSVRRRAIGSYQLVFANSRYTQEWIGLYWGRDAEVIYAVVDDMGPMTSKDKIILNVGRFYAKTESETLKRQEILVEAFSGMTEAHQRGWTLHLAGSFARDPRSRRLAEQLRLAAKDLPIVFHFDIPFDELRQLYRRAAIYWHATGYGHDPDEDPETQEHFGISTVEAMSAGGVPVVIDTAGQKESVEHGRNGFLWHALPDLTTLTDRLIRDDPLRERLSERAIRTSARFSRATFCRRFDELVTAATDGPGSAEWSLHE